MKLSKIYKVMLIGGVATAAIVAPIAIMVPKVTSSNNTHQDSKVVASSESKVSGSSNHLQEVSSNQNSIDNQNIIEQYASRVVLNDSLDSNKFIFNGSNGSKIVSYEDTTKLSKELELYYSTDEGKTWSLIAPTNLSDGEKIQAMLAVKKELVADYVIHQSPVQLTVFTKPVEKVVVSTIKIATISTSSEQLNKSIISDVLDQNELIFIGFNEKGTVEYNTPLDSKLEIQYSVNGGDFSNVAPSTLKHGDILSAKLSVKKEFVNQYQVDQTVETKVVGHLSRHKLGASLGANDFSVVGSNGAGTISYKPATPLDSHLEVRYNVNDGIFTSKIPKNLKNGDKITVRVFPKSGNDFSYETKVVAAKFSVKDLTTDKTNTLSINDWKDISVDEYPVN